MKRNAENELYRSNLIAFVVDEAHCVKKWLVLFSVMTHRYMLVYINCHVFHSSYAGRHFSNRVCPTGGNSKYPTTRYTCDGPHCNSIKITSRFCHEDIEYAKCSYCCCVT